MFIWAPKVLGDLEDIQGTAVHKVFGPSRHLKSTWVLRHWRHSRNFKLLKDISPYCTTLLSTCVGSIPKNFSPFSFVSRRRKWEKWWRAIDFSSRPHYFPLIYLATDSFLVTFLVSLYWSLLFHNFIQLSLNSGSAQVQILLAECQRIWMVRISDNSPGWK